MKHFLTQRPIFLQGNLPDVQAALVDSKKDTENQPQNEAAVQGLLTAELQLVRDMVQKGTMHQELAEVISEAAAQIKDEALLSTGIASLKEQDRINAEINADRDILKEMSESRLDASREIFIFPKTHPHGQKARLLLTEVQSHLKGKLAGKKTAPELHNEIRDLVKKMQTEREDQESLHAEAQGHWRKAVLAFKEEGWIDSIPIFFEAYENLLEIAKKNGAASEYAAACAEIVGKDLRTAQSKAAEKLSKEIAKMVQSFSWEDSYEGHSKILEQLAALEDVGVLTGPLRFVQKQAHRNLKKCELEISGQEKAEELATQRLAAEQLPSWLESKAEHERLLRICEQGGLHGKSQELKEEHIRIKNNLAECERNIQLDLQLGKIVRGKDGKLIAAEEEAVGTSEESAMAWIEEHIADIDSGLDATLAFIAIGADRGNQRRNQEIEETSNQVRTEFIDERAEDVMATYDFDYANDNEEIEVNHVAEEITVGQSATADERSREQETEAVVEKDLAEVKITKQAFTHGSTRDAAIEQEKALEKEQDFAFVGENENVTFSAYNAMDATMRIMRDDLIRFAANDNANVSTAAISAGVRAYAKNIITRKAASREGARELTRKVKRAA